VKENVELLFETIYDVRRILIQGVNGENLIIWKDRGKNEKRLIA
jgi:hypothetical protein